MQDSEKYRAILLEPKVGDLIVMKLEKENDSKPKFGITKVISVNEKEVQLKPSKYQFSSKSDAISKDSKKLLIDSDAFSENDLPPYQRLQLVELFDTGYIKAAIRDNN
jgi:hypothetical protein